MKSCCFIGHREIPNEALVLSRVKEIIEALIIGQDVRMFLFGSRSRFNDICHAAVTELQKTYRDIVRVNYNLKSEYSFTKKDYESLSSRWRDNQRLKWFEFSENSDKLQNAGKASYAERNQMMIDSSDFCVFFCLEDYKPKPNPYRRTSGNSGTRLAYTYALRKKKIIINVADIL